MAWRAGCSLLRQRDGAAQPTAAIGAVQDFPDTTRVVNLQGPVSRQLGRRWRQLHGGERALHRVRVIAKV